MHGSRNVVGLATALLLGLTAILQAAPLAQAGLVLVVRSGTGPAGQPLYSIADSSNTGAKNIWDQISSSTEVRRATAVYQKVQEERKERIRRELAADGSLSADDQAILDDLPGPHPVYVEVKAGTGGAYNDWKSQFTLEGSSGQLENIAAPRIVFQANDPVAVGGDSSLLRQTMVHEISHGFHALMVGPMNTPQTPWLSKPHAGNTTSDGTLALIEGYAEFVAAHLTGRKTIANDPADAIPNNLYVYGSDGKVKSADELWKTEGWAATVLYKISNSSSIDDGFDKINDVIAERNPQTFKELIETYQEMFPDDRSAVRSLIASASLDQIYSGSSGGAGGGYADAGGGGQDAGGGGSVLDDLWNGQETGSGLPIAKIASMLGGGVLGAVLGVSFGPVGIAVAAAAGAGLGYVISNYFFDQDAESQTFVNGRWPLSPAGSSDSQVDASPASPGGILDPENAKRALDEAYRKYLKEIAARTSDAAVTAARTVYEAAKTTYETALAGTR